MAGNLLFGFEAVAYFSSTKLDGKIATAGTSNDAHQQAISGTPDFDGSPPETGNWNVIDNIRDLTFSADAEAVDTTTRAEAAEGWDSQVFTTNRGQVSFTARWKPGDTAFDVLKNAWLARDFVSLMFLDQALGVNGAQGLVANWSVSFSINQPIKDLQTVDVTLNVAEYPEWVYANATGNAVQLTSP